MRIWKCLTLRKEGLPPDALNEIFQCYSPFSEGTGFRHESRLECQPGDTQAAEAIEQLLRILAKHGLPQTQGWAPASYFFEANRRYESEDFLAVELLRVGIHPNEIQVEHKRDDAGRLILVRNTIRQGFRIGGVSPNHHVVSDEIKNLMTSANLIGIEFKGVMMQDGAVTASPQKVWELNSTFTLPKMANMHQFVSCGKAGLQ